MGIFQSSAPASPPPPPPLPPSAPAPTLASASVQNTGQAAQQRAKNAAGSGFAGTDLTGGQGTGSGDTAKTALLGATGGGKSPLLGGLFA